MEVKKTTLDLHYALHEAEMQEVEIEKEEYNRKVQGKRVSNEQMNAILEMEKEQLKAQLEELQIEHQRLKEVYEKEHSELICFYKQSVFSFLRNKRKKDGREYDESK